MSYLRMGPWSMWHCQNPCPTPAGWGGRIAPFLPSHPARAGHGFWQCHIDQGPIRKYDIPHTCLYGRFNISNVVSFQSARFDACTSLLSVLYVSNFCRSHEWVKLTVRILRKISTIWYSTAHCAVSIKATALYRKNILTFSTLIKFRWNITYSMLPRVALILLIFSSLL